MRAEFLAAVDVERLLAQQAAFIEAARPYLRLLSEAAGTERHAAMLGDAVGFVLDVVGDERSVRGRESVPGPGSLLDERMSGANGIGTPLAEGDYVDIVAAEHFIIGFRPFTCQGIPILSPDRCLAGVISTSVRSPAASSRLKHILFCAAQGIEADLLAARLQADIAAFLSASSPDAAALRRLHQDVVQAHNAGRIGLEVAAQLAQRYERPESVLNVLQHAHACLRQFMDRASTWRQLAGSERGVDARFDLAAVGRRIVDLLGTEAAVRRVTVSLTHLDEPLSAFGDERTVARRVLRYVTAAIDAAGEGGAVSVEPRHRRDQAVEIGITATPAVCEQQAEPLRWALEMPPSRVDP